MFTLAEETKKNISRNVGLSFEKICAAETLDKEKTVGFSHEKKLPIYGRGNPYLARRRFTTMEELDALIEEEIKDNDRDGNRR